MMKAEMSHVTCVMFLIYMSFYSQMKEEVPRKSGCSLISCFYILCMAVFLSYLSILTLVCIVKVALFL